MTCGKQCGNKFLKGIKKKMRIGFKEEKILVTKYGNCNYSNTMIAENKVF